MDRREPEPQAWQTGRNDRTSGGCAARRTSEKYLAESPYEQTGAQRDSAAPFQKLVRIEATDGNEFTGIVDTEDPQTVELITVMGLIKLPKAAIRQRSEIDSQKAFE